MTLWQMGRRQAVAPKWGVTREQHGRHLGRWPLLAGLGPQSTWGGPRRHQGRFATRLRH